MKRFFSVQTNLKSYTYPIIKIVISVLIIFFAIFRKSLFTISLRSLDICLTVVCFAAGIVSVLCIYIAIAELLYAKKNK